MIENRKTARATSVHDITSVQPVSPPAGAEPDPGLIAQALEGDHRAFLQIVRRYEQTVYSFAYKVCRDREKAAETLQDTFVNVFRKLHQFDRRSKFTTWLYSIVANNCMMKHRRTKLDAMAVPIDEVLQDQDHPPFHGEPPLSTWKSTPLEGIMNRELKEVLDKAIRKLPLDYRAVFILRDVEGRSAEETAKILALSIPAVKSRLRRARVFLRNQLNGYMTR